MAGRAPHCMLVVSCSDVATRADAIRAALTAGVDTIQLRDRSSSGRTLHAAAVTLRTWTTAHGAALVVNDRLDIAVAANADGAHLPGASFPIETARSVLGPAPWIGRSTHSPEEARHAADAGADYVILGPIHDTPSKRPYGPPLGPTVFEGLALPVPVIAIGGITATNAGEVIANGATGIAVIREILDAPDPKRASTDLLAALR